MTQRIHNPSGGEKESIERVSARSLKVVTKKGHVDYPILYDDGHIAWDFPERVSARLKHKAERLLRHGIRIPNQDLGGGPPYSCFTCGGTFGRKLKACKKCGEPVCAKCKKKHAAEHKEVDAIRGNPSRARFRHEDVSAVPAGWKVRTVAHGDHRIRIAFPPGRKVKGAGRLVSVLHPTKENPSDGCHARSTNPADLVVLGANPPRKRGMNPKAIFSKGSKVLRVVFTASEMRGYARMFPNARIREEKLTIGFDRAGNVRGWSPAYAQNLIAPEAWERIKQDAFAYLHKKTRGRIGNPDVSPEMREKLDRLVKGWHEAGRASFQRQFANLDYDSPTYQKTWKVRSKKWIALDDGTSGAFMLNQEDGNIYNIKSKYGVPNLKKLVGNINTMTGEQMDRFRWNYHYNPGELVLMGANPLPAWAEHPWKLSQKEFVEHDLRHGFISARTGKRIIPENEPPKERQWWAERSAGIHRQYVIDALRDGKPVPVNVLADYPDLRRSNPSETAPELFETFQGRPSTKVTVVDEPHMPRGDYAQLGRLVELGIEPNGHGTVIPLEFSRKDAVILAAAPGHQQIYFVGGNQDITACLEELEVNADLAAQPEVRLGRVRTIAYRAGKAQTDFVESDWEHAFGEEGGEPPTAYFDTQHKRILLKGGSYRIESPGIIN